MRPTLVEELRCAISDLTTQMAKKRAAHTKALASMQAEIDGLCDKNERLREENIRIGAQLERAYEALAQERFGGLP